VPNCRALFAWYDGPLGTQFACFTSFTGTKVQNLTQKPLLVTAMRNGDLLLIDEISLGTLLALLVQKYKYCPLITAMHNGELLLMDEISRGSQYADVC
jgi:hypothetical protein